MLQLKDMNRLALSVIASRASEIAAVLINPLQCFHLNASPPSDLVLQTNNRKVGARSAGYKECHPNPNPNPNPNPSPNANPNPNPSPSPSPNLGGVTLGVAPPRDDAIKELATRDLRMARARVRARARARHP